MNEADGGGGGGLSAHQIYVALTSGPGTGSLEGAYRSADSEAALEAERAELVQRLAGKIEGGWEGQAGAAAFGAAKPLADVSYLGAVNLEKTHVLLAQQSSGFTSASGEVYPVAENPPESNWWDDVTPWDTDTEDEQARYRDQAAHNVAVYQRYDNQSMTNEQALPMDYSSLDDPGGSISVDKPGEPGQPEKPGTNEKKEPWQPGGGDGRDKSNPPPPPYSIDRPPPPPPTTDQGRTDPQWVDPDQNQTRPSQVELPPRTDPTRPPVGPYPPQPPNGPNGPWGPGGPGGPYGQGGGQYGPGRPGGFGPGGARGGFGPGGGGAGGSGYGPGGARGMGGGGFGPGGGGASGAEPHGPGGRSGAGALGAEPHGGAAGRGGAAGGRGGGAGMGGGMGGGGRGQGGEDSEHTRASFLQEDDPEAIFGTDEVTAPPVIGE